jgi:integrase
MQQVTIQKNDAVRPFIKWLKQKHKTNGDKLVESTIERYTEWISKYIDELDRMKPDGSMIVYMNQEVFATRSSVLASAFKNYLLYRKAPKRLLLDIEKTEKRANAFTSIRFLQDKVLSRTELKRVMNQLDDLQLRAAFSFLYDTACRRAEMLNTRWGDIQFKHSITDAADIHDGLYASVTITGKGSKKREVYLGRTTVDLLREMRGNDKKNPVDKVFVITKKNGEAYKRQHHAFYDRVVRVSERILGRHIHPHCFRHTKLTHLADSGADLLSISAYAGHASTAVTQIYLHISSYRGRQAFKQYSKDIMEEA